MSPPTICAAGLKQVAADLGPVNSGQQCSITRDTMFIA
jgi:hypothetical protein